jgi:hypothetical protein
MLERHRGEPITQDTLPGMLARLVVVMLVVGCGACGGGEPRPTSPAPRRTFARSELPAEIVAVLPNHGVYLAGGGTRSAVFRVIVDTDGKAIYTGTAPAGTPVLGAMAEGRTRALTPRNEEHLVGLCADARNEAAAQAASNPVEGYEEWLVIANGDELFVLHERGPIKRPKAMRAVEALRAAAAL